MLKNTAEEIDTTIAGTRAIRPNQTASRVCRRAPTLRRFRATQTDTSRRATVAASTRNSTRSTLRSTRTVCGSAAKGNDPVSAA